MIIKDFFSHKIHSSGSDWPDKLVELAFIFAEFDGQLYDRDAIEKRLIQISPRSSFVARDRSRFRDVYSAYPAYFGLYRLEPSSKGWIIKLSSTTRLFLLQEEPDVTSFLLLQLTLLQYPNGIGAAFYPGTNNLRIQSNTRDRTLSFVHNNVHLSPLRLIVMALIADSEIRKIPLHKASITFDEIFALANQGAVNAKALPTRDVVRKHLAKARQGEIAPPPRYESRFHLLKHLNLFKIGQGMVRIRDDANDIDLDDLVRKVRAISQVKNEFRGLDNIRDGSDIEDIIRQGLWGSYFDGINTIDRNIVNILTADLVKDFSPIVRGVEDIPDVIEPVIYPLRPRNQTIPKPTKHSRQHELANPETTRIKRQRRNFYHKILVDKMDGFLRNLGADPMESQHIDLYAQIPNDGSFIFEMKSGGPNLLAQIRKGLSQLYEYRFRYRSGLKDPITLCLVLYEKPGDISWVQEYLCSDRNVCLCWFDSNGELEHPPECHGLMQNLIQD
ncbi:MAG: hypothetical protein KDE48_24495 [Anaerolineales bacterium]|nr:hypothetical protein [Anaerolineales bacterium]